MIPAALYARESADESLSTGTSIPAQVSEIRAYAEREGFSIVAEFVDEHIKGWDKDRPAFNRLLEEVRGKECRFQVILVWDYSRFARDAAAAMQISDELEDLDIQLVSVSEGVIPGPEGRLTRNIKHVLNDYYKVQFGRNVLRGIKHSVEQGFAPGGLPPFGYKKIFVEDGKNMRRKYEPDPNESPWVGKIYNWFIEGSSINSIARRLNELKVPTKRGNGSFWGDKQILRILRDYSQTYLGHTTFNRVRHKKQTGKVKPKDRSEWVTAQNTHEPIISTEQAKAVETRLETRKETGRSPDPYRDLLTGLLYCANCGSKYMVRHNTGVRYYTCRKHWIERVQSQPATCRQPYLRTEIADELVSRVALNVLMSPSFAQDLQKAHSKHRKQQLGNRRTATEKITKRLQKLEWEKNNILTAISEGLPWVTAKEKVEAITKQIEEAKEEMEQAVVITPLSEDPTALIESLLEIRGSVEGNQKTTHALLRTLITRIEISGHTGVLHWNIPLDPLTITFPIRSNSVKKF